MQFEREILAILHWIDRKLDRVLKREGTFMATIEELIAKVTEEDNAEDAVVLALKGENEQLKKDLTAALAAGIPPSVQAKIDAMFAAAEARRARLAAAVVANTPAAPEAPPSAPPAATPPAAPPQ